MKFGIFDYIDDRGEPLHKTYDDRLALLQAAEAAGFYGYHLTEHHATPLSMTPSPGVFLAAAARETQRIRLGTLLYLLPLYHPLRLFEELCMLDHLSHGRLDVGLGRGISPMEFEAYGVDFGQSGRDFDHVFNILYQGFTRDRIDYQGDRFDFHDVPVIMKPLQSPHPPFWYGLRGDHGPAFAARQGMHGVTLGSDEKVAKMLATFRAQWAACAHERKRRAVPVEKPFCGVMRAIFVATPMRKPSAWRGLLISAGSMLLPGCGWNAVRFRRSPSRPITMPPRPQAPWSWGVPIRLAAFCSRRRSGSGTITWCCCLRSDR